MYVTYYLECELCTRIVPLLGLLEKGTKCENNLHEMYLNKFSEKMKDLTIAK